MGWACRSRRSAGSSEVLVVGAGREFSSRAGASVAQAIARVVSFARGATMSWTSVNVLVGQAGWRHHQTAPTRPAGP